MYEAFFNLSNDPFRLLPDPGICFPHRSCAKAWAYLRYALKRGEGIVVVTGPPGSGKTTLAERLLNELNPAKTVSVRLIANDLNATDLLRKLAYSLGLPAEGMDRAMLAHRIERYLIELEHSNRRALVVIDEAQTLSHHSLEAMRLLTDMQSRSRPVLQLILLGQEELEGVMSAPGMEQFQHRVIASCRLHTMDLMETKAYLEYRLGYADWHGDPSFNGPAVMAIFQESRGLPRHVNKICSRLLLHASSEERHALNERDVHAVMRDLREEWIAPLDGDALRSQRVPSGALDSVYELALVPGTRPAPSPRKATVREGAPDLAVGEERSTASGGVKNTAAPAPGGYLYGMSRRRSPALLRRVRGLLRGAFDQFARLVERSVDWTSGFGGYLARGYAQSQRWWRQASSWLRAWLDGAGFPALLERARPLLDGDRRMLGAGVGAVVVAALVITVLVVSWDAGQQQRPAAASVAASEGEAIDGHLDKDAFPAGQSVLGDAGAYLEAAAAGASPGDPLGQGSPTATAARLPTSGMPDGPDPAATVGLDRSKQSANAADLDSVAG
ncbi:MAG: AAA family ATPase, partial [Chromatiaceae bacterium]|nr:AAA family ATPase [Chromatiaceae bacterium]